MHRSALRRLASAVLALLAIGSGAAQVHGDDIYGGAGGAYFESGCSGRVLVGLAGTASDVVNRLEPICARIDANGRWVSVPFEGRAVGSRSGVPIAFRTMCPRDSFVSSISGYLSSSWITHIELHCRYLGPTGAEQRPARPQIVGAQGKPFTGFTRGCGDNGAASGIKGRAGEAIDALGVLCTSVVLGLPERAPDPIPPAITLKDNLDVIVAPKLDDGAADVLRKPDGIVQPSGAVDVFRPVPGTATPSQEVELPTEFRNPEINGLAVDYCLTWGQNCGKPAADAFCRRQGFARSEGHQVYERSPPTILIGDGAICREPYCARMISISCSR